MLTWPRVSLSPGARTQLRPSATGNVTEGLVEGSGGGGNCSVSWLFTYRLAGVAG